MPMIVPVERDFDDDSDGELLDEPVSLDVGAGIREVVRKPEGAGLASPVPVGFAGTFAGAVAAV